MSAVVKDSIAKLNQEQGKPWRLPRDNRETFTMAIHVNLRFVKCNWKLGKDAKKKKTTTKYWNQGWWEEEAWRKWKSKCLARLRKPECVVDIEIKGPY